jgi:hypothetical protein
MDTTPVRPRGPVTVLLMVLALLAVLVAGCAGAGDDTADSGGEAAVVRQDDSGAEGPGPEDMAGDMEGDAAAEEASDGGAGSAADAAQVRAQVSADQDRMIARDATLSLVVDDIDASAAQVRAAAVAAEGYVVSEEVVPTRESVGDPGYATFVLSVPSARLDATLEQLGTYGTVTSSTLTSQDVTERYVDTTARIETLEASVDRVRGLLEEATTIADIVDLEAELASREAELDAMLAVQQSIEADVSRSSVTVHLSTDEGLLLAAEEDDSGFLAGLRQGWEAFGAATAVLLTGIGAVLPFLVAAAVVAVPVVALSRRRRAGGSTAPAAPPA